VLRITTKGKNIRRGKVADANAEHLSEAPTSSMLVNREAANQSHPAGRMPCSRLPCRC
jgi:hypothetical protein